MPWHFLLRHFTISAIPRDYCRRFTTASLYGTEKHGVFGNTPEREYLIPQSAFCLSTSRRSTFLEIYVYYNECSQKSLRITILNYTSIGKRRFESTPGQSFGKPYSFGYRRGHCRRQNSAWLSLFAIQSSTFSRCPMCVNLPTKVMVLGRTRCPYSFTRSYAVEWLYRFAVI